MSEEQRAEIIRTAEKQRRIIYLFHNERRADSEREEETTRMFEETIAFWVKRKAEMEAKQNET